MAKIIKGVGMGAAMVAAGYAGAVAFEVLSAEREEAKIEVAKATAAARAALAEKQAEREDKVVSVLKQEVDVQQGALEQLDGELETARQQVSELERLRAAQLGQLATAAAAAEEAELRLQKLRQDALRYRETASFAAQALVEAHQVAQEKRQLVNPMNHPLVKRFRVGQ